MITICHFCVGYGSFHELMREIVLKKKRKETTNIQIRFFPNLMLHQQSPQHLHHCSICVSFPPGAPYSKVPRLFGRISVDTILFVSSKRRRLESRNFTIILAFVPFTTYKKISFLE